MVKGLGVMLILRSFSVITALVLAGCSVGNDPVPTEVELLNTTRQILTANRAPKIVRLPLTRAALEPLEEAILEVTLERKERLAYLSVNAVRRDKHPGRITVWRTEDNVTLAMRNGVLIATRGLGGDVISSVVQVSGEDPGPSGSGEHVQFVRSLDNQEVPLVMACEVIDLGIEIITIVERKHSTRHLQQRCTGNGEDIMNDYWIDSRASLVWQSRQWAGPYIGYMRFRQLTN
jgi:hypothetical protein